MRLTLSSVCAAGLGGAGLAGVLLAGTASSGTASSGTASSGTVRASARYAVSSYHSGTPVDVLFAGSLVAVMEDHVGPAFHQATGYGFEGFSDGSKALAADIKGRLRPADVFISGSPKVDKTLEGKANGDWVTIYRTFAYSYLELGYNGRSKFAGQLRTKPWYRVVGQSGFKLGRTDPATDPKGVLAVEALDGAAAKYHQPALKALAAGTTNVFPETDLVGRLELGDLDAGFFYGVEATTAKIPAVPLTGFSNLKATYTVATVNHAPHAAGAQAFVAWLTSARGTKILDQEGLTTVK